MKLVTLHQPWATFVACGVKRYETRHWSTDYRGELLIHAAAKPMDRYCKGLYEEVCSLRPFMPRVSEVPLGKIISLVSLTNCLRMVETVTDFWGADDPVVWIPRVSELERKVGGWCLNRFAFSLQDAVKLSEPIPYKASQGKLLNVSEELEAEVYGQIQYGHR